MTASQENHINVYSYIVSQAHYKAIQKLRYWFEIEVHCNYSVDGWFLKWLFLDNRSDKSAIRLKCLES